MNPFGQIGQQIADNSIEIVKDTAKSVVKAGTDIAVGTVEQITSAPTSKGAAQGDKSVEQGKGANDPNLAAQKKAADRKRLEEVKGEIAQYVQRKRQLDVKIAQEKAQAQQQENQVKQQEKQKRDSWAARLLKKVGAGSHGETAKQKE